MDLNRQDKSGLVARSWEHLLLSLVLILQIVETIVTVTVETKLPYNIKLVKSDCDSQLSRAQD